MSVARTLPSTAFGLSALVLALAWTGRATPAITPLGIAGLVLLVLAARARIARGPAPSPVAVVIAVLTGVAFFGALVLGGLAWPLLESSPAVIATRLPPTLAGLAGLGLAALFAWPSLEESRGDPGDVPATPWLPAAFTGSALHLWLFLACPPLIQLDSAANLFEPPLFALAWDTPHHPPLYAEAVKALVGLDPLRGLTLLMAAQHVLVVGVAALFARTIALETGSRLAAGLGGVALAVDGHLAAFSQLVMTEALAVVFLVGAVAFAAEASRRERAGPWLLAAGTCAALATLTRQVAQAWFVLACLWLVLGRVRPRRGAVLVFAIAAVAPVAFFVLHNLFFQGRASLTSSGRVLSYRTVQEMPELTDPSAPPGDELERARAIVWRERENCWMGPYQALRNELAWSDERIDGTIPRFYVEQALRHPWHFTRVTVRYFADLLRGSEPFEGLLAFHDACLDNPTTAPVWHALPRTTASPALSTVLAATSTSASAPVLLLAALAPLLARGRARWLALFAVASAAYFLLVAALFQPPLARFRIPASPFVILAAAVSIARLGELATSRAKEPTS